MTRTIHFVFDQPPCPEGARFIKCETPDGKSVNMGPWLPRADGFWELAVEDGRERIAELEKALRKAEIWCRTRKGYPTTESKFVESCMNEVGVEVTS